MASSDSPHPRNSNDGPSSPNSSLIGNTISSPSTRRRFRRGRSSTPTQFATPPPNSRHASSNSTPPTSRPSAARSNGRNGQPPTTPSYTDEPPPSSEDGEEYAAGDDTAPTFVWGTNISVQDVKSAIEMFVKHFREAKENSEDLFREGKYMASIRKVIEIEGEWIDVDAYDVFDYDHDLYNKMVRYPLEVLAIFDIVLMEIVSNINELFEKHVQVRIFNLRTSTSMRNLNPSG